MAKKHYNARSGIRGLSIGTKTLVAFLLIITVLTGGFYLFSTSTLSSQEEQEAFETVSAKLDGARGLYNTRMEQMKFGMLQASTLPSVKAAIIAKDSAFLQKLLGNYAKYRPYVDLWVAVDTRGRVVGSKAPAPGGTFEVNGVVATSLRTGEPVLSTEAVAAGVLAGHGIEAEGEALVQVVSVPVKSGEEVIGALVTGMVLNGNGWPASAISTNLQADSALYSLTEEGPRVISASGRVEPGFSQELAKGMENASGGIGRATLAGLDVQLGTHPIKDFAGEIIGGMAVWTEIKPLGGHAWGIKKNLLVAMGLGIFFSLILAGLVYRGTVRPINTILSAMNDTTRGKLDVRVDIKTGDEFELIGNGFNKMVDSIADREKRLNDSVEFSNILIESKEPAETASGAIKKISEMTGSTRGVVYIYDTEIGILWPCDSYGIPEGELTILRVDEEFLTRCKDCHKTSGGEGIEAGGEFIDCGVAGVVPPGLTSYVLCFGKRLSGILMIGGEEPLGIEEKRHIERLVRQLSIVLNSANIQKDIERLSATDPLTGLLNRRHFFERLQGEFTSAKRYNYNISVLMIDIDDFKSINDEFGHQTGDAVLEAMGLVLKEQTRSTDTWGRYGGEEFIGFVSHCDARGAIVLAEKIRKEVEQACTLGGVEQRRVTVSLGIGSYPFDEADCYEELVKTADEQLYKAKRGGKNMVTASKQLYSMIDGGKKAG